MEKILEATSIDTVMSLFGSFDANVKLIEREMGVRITNKDTQIKIIGDNCRVACIDKLNCFFDIFIFSFLIG